MDTSIKIAANTIIQGLGKLITASTTFVVVVLVSRALGASGYGDFVKIFAVVEIFYLITDFGLNAIAVKYITQKEDRAKEVMSNLLAIRLAMSVVLILVVVVVSALLPYQNGQGFSPQVKLGILAASLTILTQAMLLTNNAFFQAILRYDKMVIAQTIGSALKLSLIFFVTRSQVDIFVLTWSLIAADTVMVVASFYQLIGKLGWVFPKLIKRIALSFIKESWPLGLSLVFTQIYFRIDTVILGIFRPAVEVGLYNLAYRFFDLALVAPIFFTNALYPVLIKQYQIGMANFIKSALISSGVLLLAGITATAGLTIFGPLAISWFFGQEFLGSVDALVIFAWQLPVFYLTSLLMWILIVLGRQKLLIFFYGSGAVLNVVLNLYFIPLYGYLAAAIITGFSEVYILILLLLANIKIIKSKKPIN
ncbi:flippase [Candidatus Daviesbacteria bacterium]|nr:flippase [Candidatus Daviesbacteria bacterium]